MANTRINNLKLLYYLNQVFNTSTAKKKCKRAFTRTQQNALIRFPICYLVTLFHKFVCFHNVDMLE